MPAAPRSNVPQDASTLAVVAPLVCALSALACLCVSWWIIFQASIGPVVATLTTSHGVHSGDVFGLCAMALSFAFAGRTYTSLRRPRPSLALVSRG